MIRLVEIDKNLLEKYKNRSYNTSNKKCFQWYRKLIKRYKKGKTYENPKLIPYILKNIDKAIGMSIIAYVNLTIRLEFSKTTIKKSILIHNMIYSIFRLRDLGVFIMDDSDKFIESKILYKEIEDIYVKVAWEKVGNMFKKPSGDFMLIMKNLSDDLNEIFTLMKRFMELGYIIFPVYIGFPKTLVKHSRKSPIATHTSSL